MSNRCWMRRRTKQGLAHRQMASIARQMRRAKNDPLPQRFISRGTGLKVTVVLAPPGTRFDDEPPEGVMDELWDEEPEFDGTTPYDPDLSLDQARWRPHAST